MQLTYNFLFHRLPAFFMIVLICFSNWQERSFKQMVFADNPDLRLRCSGEDLTCMFYRALSTISALQTITDPAVR